MKLRITADVKCGIRTLYAIVKGDPFDGRGFAETLMALAGQPPFGPREVPDCENWIRDVRIVVTSKKVSAGALGSMVGSSAYAIDPEQPKRADATLVSCGAAGHVMLCPSCWALTQARKWTVVANEKDVAA